MLVARRAICGDRGAGRPRVNLVAGGQYACRALPGPQLVGHGCGLRPVAVRRSQLPVWQRGRGLQASAVGLQRRDAAQTASGMAPCRSTFLRRLPVEALLTGATNHRHRCSSEAASRRTWRSTARRRGSDRNLTSGSAEGGEQVVHPVEPRARTAMLPPVMVSNLGIRAAASERPKEDFSRS